jgi:Lrp/AsnC family transcriptional regulator, leucine-responsive regulatory protein
MMKIDELGLGIIELLHANARATNKDIADTLAVSEATVAARIRDMESRNILRIIMQRDLRALGYDLLVLVDIHVSQRSAEEVAAELAQIEEAASVVVLLSDPDIILQLNVRDRKHLLATIEQKVAPIRGISHWTADIALEIVKLDSRYGTLDAIS